VLRHYLGDEVAFRRRPVLTKVVAGGVRGGRTRLALATGRKVDILERVVDGVTLQRLRRCVVPLVDRRGVGSRRRPLLGVRYGRLVDEEVGEGVVRGFVFVVLAAIETASPVGERFIIEWVSSVARFCN